jgi:hypothetical protein
MLDTFGMQQGGSQYRRLIEAFQRVFGATIFFGTDTQLKGDRTRSRKAGDRKPDPRIRLTAIRALRSAGEAPAPRRAVARASQRPIPPIRKPQVGRSPAHASAPVAPTPLCLSLPAGYAETIELVLLHAHTWSPPGIAIAAAGATIRRMPSPLIRAGHVSASLPTRSPSFARP